VSGQISKPTAISRRRLLGLGASLVALRPGSVAAAQDLPRTPAQTSGPFYPLEKPLDSDADLTLIKGRTQRAAGQVVHVMGRVVNSSGEPVPGARIEIWQANTHGRYTHPGDGNRAAPLDPNFEGYSRMLTDEQGRYRFKTIKPGAYPAGRSFRPPHRHFDVAGRHERLVTQMYFPGEPLNDGDAVIAAAREHRKLLIAHLQAPTAELEPDAWLARWDIVLARG
jgi:protocatechuate 3,4-dioxygenase beta subunit